MGLARMHRAAIVAVASLTSVAGLALAQNSAGAPASTPAARPAMASGSGMGAVASRHADSLVTVRFMISVGGPGGDQEIEREAGGLVIGPDGLILTSNPEMGGAIGRRPSQGQAKDIKVLIGDDTEGVPAKIIGRDSELELAWVKLDAAPAKSLAVVDPAKGATVSTGDTLVALDRMNKYYDRAVLAIESKVSGVTRKPRNLIIPLGTTIQWIGLPVFSAGGEFVGLTAIQPIAADDEDAMAMRNMGRMTPADNGLKIIPAAEIASATARALDAAKSGKGMGMDEPKPETPADTPETPASPAAPSTPAQPK